MKNIFSCLKAIPRPLGLLSLPLFFLALAFLDYAFRWIYAFTGATQLLSLKPMCFTLGWALLVTALVSLLPRRLPRRIGMLVLGGFFAFLVVLNAVMFNIFGHFFSFADMNFAGDGAKFFSWTYFHLPKKLILCIVLYLALVVTAAFLPDPILSRHARFRLRLAALGLAALAFVPIGVAAHRLAPKADSMWWGNTYDPTDERELYREFTDANRCMKLTGLYQYTFRNLVVSMGWGADGRTMEQLDQYFDQREQELALQGSNEMTGILKGKNLIMVMLESIDTWLMQPDYMPNLCGLSEEGVNFTEFYTPLFLSAGTFNTEIISQTGMVPPVSGMSSAAYSTNRFPYSLASLFAKEGYRVKSFHSANPSIYSRGSVHTNLGFEAYHSYKEMGMNDYMLDAQMLGGYELMTEGDRFYSYIITYSGHGPYTQEMDNIAGPHLKEAQAAVERSGVTGSAENMEEYTRAVAHAMETDQFIGQLVERLEAEGLLENTALVLYADHYGKYMTDKEFLAQIKGTDRSPVELYRTPCVLYGAGLKAQVMHKTGWSGDLAPTIANLYGLEGGAKYYAGEDLFNSGKGLAMFPNSGWYDGETYYSGGQEESGERTAQVKQRESASMDALRSDYFKTK